MNTRPTSDIPAYDRKSVKSKRKTRHKENIKQKVVTTDHQDVEQSKALDSILNCDDEQPPVIQYDVNTTSLQDLPHGASSPTNQITYCQSCDQELTNQKTEELVGSSKTPASPGSVDSGYSTFRLERNVSNRSHDKAKSRLKKSDSELQLERSGPSKSGHQRSMSDYGLPGSGSSTNSRSNISTSVPKSVPKQGGYFYFCQRGVMFMTVCQSVSLFIFFFFCRISQILLVGSFSKIIRRWVSAQLRSH